MRGKGKKSMASALSASLKAEDEAVKDRFERAEALLGGEETERKKEEVAKPSEPEPERKSKKRPQTIRDNFTFPEDDYQLIALLKQRCLNQAVNVSKSEIIRAGLHALEFMSDEDLLEQIENLEKLKTGRPPSN